MSKVLILNTIKLLLEYIHLKIATKPLKSIIYMIYSSPTVSVISKSIAWNGFFNFKYVEFIWRIFLIYNFSSSNVISPNFRV